jgi:hypothetical protein
MDRTIENTSLNLNFWTKLTSEFVDVLYTLNDRRVRIVKCGIERMGIEV